MIDGPNEYTYVRQNPWTKFDPEGLSMWDDACSHAFDHLETQVGLDVGLIKGAWNLTGGMVISAGCTWANLITGQDSFSDIGGIAHLGDANVRQAIVSGVYNNWANASPFQRGEMGGEDLSYAAAAGLGGVSAARSLASTTLADVDSFGEALGFSKGYFTTNGESGSLNLPVGKGMNNPTVAGAANMGNKVHYDILNGGTGTWLPSAIQARFPYTTFNFTRRGQAGADVEVTGGTHPSDTTVYPGSTWSPTNKFGDFKPNTKSGQRTFNRDIRKGKLPTDTQNLPYDSTTGALK